MAQAAERAGRIDEPLPRTLLGLTFVTGMVDAISFLGLGLVFAGMMTGNVLFLGFGIAGASDESLTAPLIAIAAFVAGSLLGGMIAARERTRSDSGLVASITLEAALLAVAAVIAASVSVHRDEAAAWLLIGILSLAMGARITVVGRIGVPELPTNVLRVAVASFEAGTAVAGASPSHLVPRAAAVLAMLGGAVAGALLLDQVSLAAALGVAAGVTMLAGLAYRV